MLHYEGVHTPGYGERIKVAVDELIHHPKETFDAIGSKYQVKRSDIDKYNDEHQDKWEAKKFKELSGEELEDRGWLGNLATKVGLIKPHTISEVEAEKQRQEAERLRKQQEAAEEEDRGWLGSLAYKAGILKHHHNPELESQTTLGKNVGVSNVLGTGVIGSNLEQSKKRQGDITANLDESEELFMFNPS